MRQDKCRFGYPDRELVGHMVSKEGHRPSPSLMEKLRTKEELLRFLGLVNLTEQTLLCLYTGSHTTSVEWIWEEVTETALITLTTTIDQYPGYSGIPGLAEGFILQVDASTQTVGGVLSQGDEEQNIRPIAYLSSGLTPAQKN